MMKGEMKFAEAAMNVTGTCSEETVNIMLRIIQPLIATPSDVTKHRLRLTNTRLANTIGREPAACDYLIACGFERELIENEPHLVLPAGSLDVDRCGEAYEALEQSKLNKLRSPFDPYKSSIAATNVTARSKAYLPSQSSQDSQKGGNNEARADSMYDPQALQNLIQQEIERHEKPVNAPVRLMKRVFRPTDPLPTLRFHPTPAEDNVKGGNDNDTTNANNPLIVDEALGGVSAQSDGGNGAPQGTGGGLKLNFSEIRDHFTNGIPFKSAKRAQLELLKRTPCFPCTVLRVEGPDRYIVELSFRNDTSIREVCRVILDSVLSPQARSFLDASGSKIYLYESPPFKRLPANENLFRLGLTPFGRLRLGVHTTRPDCEPFQGLYFEE